MNEPEYDEIQLKVGLQRLADQADVSRAQPLASAALKAKRPNPLLGLGLGVAAASAAIAGGIALSSGPSPENAADPRVPGASASQPRSMSALAEFHQPCRGKAKELSLDEVQREATIPVTTASPKDSRFTAAYFCGDSTAEPKLQYGEAYVSFETGANASILSDLANSWNERDKREGDSRVYLTTFTGDPALVMPPDPNHKELLSGILVVRGDYMIRVMGNPGAPIEPLIDVASHLDETPGSQ
jgi:hypothetical protein